MIWINYATPRCATPFDTHKTIRRMRRVQALAGVPDAGVTVD